MNGPVFPPLEEQKPTEYRLDEISQSYPNLKNPESLIEQLRAPEFEILKRVQEKLGAVFYLDGGTIRDTLLGKEATDFDFVCTIPETPKTAHLQTPEELMRAFEDSFGQKTYIKPEKGEKATWVIKNDLGMLKLVGENFGVYRFFPKDSSMEIDIALPRIDFSSPEGLGGAKNLAAYTNPRLTFAEEAKRRDFTVNGMGLKIDFLAPEGVTGVLVDTVGGLEDLQDGILRAIGDPYERLAESLDRVTRAIRFAVVKGLAIDPALFAALQNIIAGEKGAFKRKYPDGRVVMGRPNIGINLVKSLVVDAYATLNLCDELAATGDLFRHWTQVAVPKNLPKEVSAEVRSTAKHLDSQASADIRANNYQLAKDALRSHQGAYPDASLEEIMFLMTIDLGKLHEFERTEKGKTFYSADYVVLSKQYFLETIRENGMIDQDARKPYRVHEDVVLKWMDRWHTVIGFLSDPSKLVGGEKALDVFAIFPEFDNDPLWRVAKSYFTNNPDTKVAAQRLIEMEARLVDLHKQVGAVSYEKNELLTGSDLMNCFGMKPGVAIGKIQTLAYADYWKQEFEADTPLTPEEAKLRVFMRVIQLPELRESWGAVTTTDDIQKLSSSEKDQPNVRRAIFRALEKKAFKAFMGAPMEQYSEHPVFGPEFKRRYGAIDSAENGPRVEFINVIAGRFAEDPDTVLGWMDDQFKRKDSLIHRLMPEIIEMDGCEQSPKYHSEGDVWKHTKLLFDKARELEIPLTPKLALMILYHDTGKPETREEIVKTDPKTGQTQTNVTFKGHAEVGGRIFREKLDTLGVPADVAEITRVIDLHMDFLQTGRLKNAWDVRMAFPLGDQDDLYNFMRIDTAASYSAVPRNDDAVFKPILDWGPKIYLESTKYTGIFEKELAADPEIAALYRDNTSNPMYAKIYEVYLGLISEDAGVTAERLLDEVLLKETEARQRYIQTFEINSAELLEYGLTGQQMGEVYRRRNGELLAELTTKYSQKIQTLA